MLNRATVILQRGLLWHEMTYEGWYAVTTFVGYLITKETKSMKHPLRVKLTDCGHLIHLAYHYSPSDAFKTFGMFSTFRLDMSMLILDNFDQKSRYIFRVVALNKHKIMPVHHFLYISGPIIMTFSCFINWKFGGAHGVMVIVVGSEHGDTGSNPGQEWLHFT